jgi:hypothetical protein
MGTHGDPAEYLRRFGGRERPPEQVYLVGLREPSGEVKQYPWQLAVVRLLSSLDANLAEILRVLELESRARQLEGE